MNAGMILAGGTGNRFGGDIPKQYCKLAGKPVIEYSIEAMQACGKIDMILVICGAIYKERLEAKYPVTCIEGGMTRNESLHNGICFLAEKIPKCETLLIQEAARPFLRAEIAADYIDKLKDYDAVITAQKITDSLGSNREWIVDREDFFLVQAPEAFRFELLQEHFDPASRITATYQQLPSDSTIYYNFSFPNNLKITYQQDLNLAELIRKKML